MNIFARISAIADPTRARLLLLLERHELTVGELCAATRLPQSTVSRHLKVLADDGWLSVRADGASRFYRVAGRLDASAEEMWSAVRSDVASAVESAEDEARAAEVVAQRRTRSQEFFATAAGQWDSVRAELFGERAELPALLGLLDPDWVVGDLGCGTGQVTQTLAPFVGRVIGVDQSPEMLAAARRRLSDVDGVEIRAGELEALPIEGAELDAALFVLVLHYVAEPARALAEAARVVRPGGRVLVVDMIAHSRAEYRERMGHVWPGFAEDEVTSWLEDAGFEAVRVRRLASHVEAKGPLLFAASARRRRDAAARESNMNRNGSRG